ncbi:hypothetical protein Glove_197g9 [Diversispora epigaea]|uniref:AAA+ ATPase domain-containing protein n=1 Tax=Diversispora epigaea TaxID=1348612 RepID=A0A397IKL5_9GLOM|nr:hypothetical protein Glove_197g9 [Diversispora epigaea]
MTKKFISTKTYFLRSKTKPTQKEQEEKVKVDTNKRGRKRKWHDEETTEVEETTERHPFQHLLIPTTEEHIKTPITLAETKLIYATPKNRHSKNQDQVQLPISNSTEFNYEAPKRRRRSNDQLHSPSTPTTPMTPPNSFIQQDITSSPRPLYITPESLRTVDLINLIKKPLDPSSEVIKQMKLIFRLSTLATKLIGRDKEREEIKNFLRNNIIEKTTDSLLVTGIPGTGKTALVNEVWNNMKDTIAKEAACSIKFIMINCMNMGDPKKIFENLLNNLDYNVIPNKAEEMLANIFLKPKKKKNIMHVIVLDEINVLETYHKRKLFGWTNIQNSSLILIGITNHPQNNNSFTKSLYFTPYSASALIDIIKDRLVVAQNSTFTASPQDLNTSLIQDKAIELCAKRIAASNGDCRKALEVFRQAMELVEMEREDNKSLRDTSSPIVTIQHINKITNTEVAGTSTIKRLKELTVHQLLIICTCVIMNKKKINKITYAELRSEYQKLCRKGNIVTPISSSEFHVLIQRLEFANFLQCNRAKVAANRKIKLLVEEEDFMAITKDHPILNLIDFEKFTLEEES